MTHSFVQDVAVDAAFYGRIVTALGDDQPEGLVSHMAFEVPEGGLRYVDVWESEQDWHRFRDDRLHPVVHRLLRQVFGDELPQEPDVTPLTLVHVWQGTAPASALSGHR